MEHTYKSYINEEQNNYLNKYWQHNKSEFVRKAINEELKKIKTNKKKSISEKYAQSFIMIGLGAIFILFSINTSNLIAFLLIFLLGVFFMINGLSTMGWKVFRKSKK